MYREYMKNTCVCVCGGGGGGSGNSPPPEAHRILEIIKLNESFSYSVSQTTFYIVYEARSHRSPHNLREKEIKLNGSFSYSVSQT